MVYFKIEFGLGKCPSGIGKVATKGKNETDGWAEVFSEVERMKAEGRFKTAANYLTALRSWSRYRGNDAWRFTDMTADEMGRYQQWLRDGGVCNNTASAYMRCLRALYNRATGRREPDPFAKVFTGNDRTAKRSVTAEVMARLHGLALPDGSPLRLARDLFIFGFQAMGMPFVDMAYLRKSQVKDNIISYARRKTGQQILVPVTLEMARLMRRHEVATTDFVFPILSRQTPEDLHHQYRHALRRYNYLLRRLSVMVGAEGHLSSYVARHSWASIAYQHHIDIGLIGKALGHTKSTTTMIYIKSLFDQDLALANEALMRKIGIHADDETTEPSR